MKIDTASIIKEYDAKKEAYKKLGEEIKYILQKKISEHNIKVHEIVARPKDVNSFLDKIRRKNISNPFEDIHDLVRARVVCLFLSDLKEICDIAKNEFDVFEEDDKINDDELNIFGYMCIHLKARLKHSPEERTKDIEGIPFEIQIRTISQDAWASISHYLDYKKESLIPRQLKKDLNALSGLFYVADTHFTIIKEKQKNQTAEKIKK